MFTRRARRLRRKRVWKYINRRDAEKRRDYAEKRFNLGHYAEPGAIATGHTRNYARVRIKRRIDFSSTVEHLAGRYPRGSDTVFILVYLFFVQSPTESVIHLLPVTFKSCSYSAEHTGFLIRS